MVKSMCQEFIANVRLQQLRLKSAETLQSEDLEMSDFKYFAKVLGGCEGKLSF